MLRNRNFDILKKDQSLISDDYENAFNIENTIFLIIKKNLQYILVSKVALILYLSFWECGLSWISSINV